MDYEAVIGLEIHVQLNSTTKMFCDCPNRPGDRPNRNVCPTCLWMPGAMARLSEETLEKAVLTGMALNCEIQPRSAFDQKVYYYPDLPKGFQLSQFHEPLARNGWIDILGENGQPKRLRVREIHMEEDVARLVHETEGRTRISLVDFNRAGAPLTEIVSEPDMRGPHDAMEFLRALRARIRYAGTAECSLEQGTMRVDANISLRPRGSDALNTKVEVKNMNSIRHVGDAIAHEIQRQTERLGAGGTIVLHTRLWDPVRGVTVPMRGKFSGPCVPDPSVPEIVLSQEWLTRMRGRLPEMPEAKRDRFMTQYGLGRDEAILMSSERDLADYFESAARLCAPALAASWIAGQLLPALKERAEMPGKTPVTPQRLAGLLNMVDCGELSTGAAREVFALLFDSADTPAQLVDRGSFRQISDTAEIGAVVDQVLSAHPDAVGDYRSGKKQALSFLVGQVIRASKGKANPKIARELLGVKLA